MKILGYKHVFQRLKTQKAEKDQSNIAKMLKILKPIP